MSLLLAYLPVVIAHTATSFGTATPTRVVTPESAEVTSADRFADAMERLANKGFRLRDVETFMGDELTISLTMARGKAARSLSVVYDLELERFTGFSETAGVRPTELRAYVGEQELVDNLVVAAPQGIVFGCDDYYFDFGSHMVAVGEQAFEVNVMKPRQTSNASLSELLRERLRDGELLDIREERSDSGARVMTEVVFVVESAVGREEIRIQQGVHPRVSILHAPGAHSRGSYLDVPSVVAALEAQPLQKVRFDHGTFGEPMAAVLSFAGGGSVVVDFERFDGGDDPCGC